MKWSAYIEENEVRKTISILKPNNQLFEVRILGGDDKVTLSGYFTDVNVLIKAFDNVDVRDRNIYILLHELNMDCYARKQHDKFLRTKQATSDTDVLSYQWLFIDLDPVRPVGISSTDQELEYARKLKDKVYSYLQDLGFSEPVVALSGNGYHLLYRINVKHDEAGRELIDRCLKSLAAMFDTDKVKVDTSNYNPSRICKLHGTLAQKGANTDSRPHRMSRILSADPEPKLTPIDKLQMLAAEIPEEPKPVRMRSYQQSEFDLLEFMRTHGLTYTEDRSGGRDGSKIYRLDECPFNPSHKDGDAKIFQYSDGSIAFKCHHNSCRRYKWQDVRQKFDPDAYNHEDNDERIDAGYQQHLKLVQAERASQPPEPKSKKKKKFRKLKSAEALLAKDLPEPKVFVGVGDELPLLLEGTCILSAKPKLGKSWFALDMCLAVANGDDFMGYKTHKCGALYLDLETGEVLQQKRLKKALHGQPVPKGFYMETETDSLNDGFVDQIEAYLQEDPTIGVVVIDVFQIIRSPAKGIKESEYEHAYRDIAPLNELALKHHLAIILICHDRKAVDPDDPFSNILGSTGLQGAATQMIVMFRKRKDDPIHVSVKGKTIDGLPELNVKLENAQWSIVEGVNTAAREKAELMEQYQASDIRRAVIAIANSNAMWKGRCSTLINDAIELGVPLEESPKTVGGFLHKHQGRFLKEDNVKIGIIDNGTGPKIYKIEYFTIDTIDGNILSTIDGFEKVNDYAGSQIPFL